MAAHVAITPASAIESVMSAPVPSPLRDRVFLFSGGDIARDSEFAWLGMVGAPSGLLHADGPRVRLMGGVGRYRYRTDNAPGGVNIGFAGTGELMLGWQQSFAPLTATTYLGAHVEDHRLVILDPGNRVVGTRFGVKAAAELFARLGQDWIATTTMAASSVYRSYHARATIAHEPVPGLALGLETAVHGDRRYHEPRAGLLASGTFNRTVITLAGGVLSNSDKGGGTYLTLSVYAPY